MGCGCGGKKFSSTTVNQRSGVTVSTSAQASVSTGNRTVVQSSGVSFGKAPTIQPMQRKTV